MRSVVSIVVATGQNRAIGMNNQLPWHLPEDLQHFKKTTTGHTLLMGRKTFESIGKPLPGRRTIVLTQSKTWRHDGCEVAHSLEQAIALSATTPERQVFIVGGANVYTQTLAADLATEIVLTEVAIAPDADAFFPVLDSTKWREASRESATSRTGLEYAIVKLVKI
jgi:dihydrofolate reductase